MHKISSSWNTTCVMIVASRSIQMHHIGAIQWGLFQGTLLTDATQQEHDDHSNSKPTPFIAFRADRCIYSREGVGGVIIPTCHKMATRSMHQRASTRPRQSPGATSSPYGIDYYYYYLFHNIEAHTCCCCKSLCFSLGTSILNLTSISLARASAPDLKLPASAAAAA